MFGGSAKKQKEIDREQQQQVADTFNVASDFLMAENYRSAISAFQDFLKDYPSSEYELLAKYNLGLSYEGLGRCKAAGRYYREVIGASGKVQPRLRAQSLHRISYVYECLNRDAKVIASLMDVLRHPANISQEVIQAEIPARLAAAYARSGNQRQADEYFKLAQDGLKKLNLEIRDHAKKQKILGKTLYYMGRLSNHSIDTMEPMKYVETLRFLQPYLLRASEFRSSAFAPMAANELAEAYDKVWKKIASVKVTRQGEEVLNQRATKEQRNRLAQQALASVQALKAQRFPDKNEPVLVTKLFKEIDAQERRFQSYISTNINYNDKTKEAQSREGLIRPGQIKVPSQGAQ